MSDPSNIALNFKNMANQMLRQGVAPRHVRRTIDELKDHRNDLREEALKRGLSEEDSWRDAESRLGSEQDLINEVLSKPELKSYASRWPWIVYGLAPVVAASMISVGVILVFGSVLVAGKAITGARYIPPVFVQHMVDGMFFFLMHVWPLIVIAATVYHSTQRWARMIWPILGVIVLGAVAAAFDVAMKWPATLEAPGFLEVGFAYAAPFPISEQNYFRTAINFGFALTCFAVGRRYRQTAIG